MMTPLKKELDHTILRVERLDKNSRKHLEQQTARHIAGGQHQGIIVNKYLAQNENVFRGQFDLRLSFKVYLVNAITQIHQQESRELRFWFDNSIVSNGKEQDRLQCAQSFFRALVNPSDFPKNYVGFIMKLMKIMQKNIFRPLIQIELEVKQIDEPFERPSSSGRSCKRFCCWCYKFDRFRPIRMTFDNSFELLTIRFKLSFQLISKSSSFLDSC